MVYTVLDDIILTTITMSFFNACSSLRASTSKLFSRAGPSAPPTQSVRLASQYVNLGDLKPSKGSNQAVCLLHTSRTSGLTIRTRDTVVELDLGVEELLEGVIKVKEPGAGMGNQHLVLRVVRHLFIDCFQRGVSLICA